MASLLGVSPRAPSLTSRQCGAVVTSRDWEAHLVWNLSSSNCQLDSPGSVPPLCLTDLICKWSYWRYLTHRAGVRIKLTYLFISTVLGLQSILYMSVRFLLLLCFHSNLWKYINTDVLSLLYHHLLQSILCLNHRYGICVYTSFVSSVLLSEDFIIRIFLHVAT